MKLEPIYKSLKIMDLPHHFIVSLENFNFLIIQNFKLISKYFKFTRPSILHNFFK